MIKRLLIVVACTLAPFAFYRLNGYLHERFGWPDEFPPHFEDSTYIKVNWFMMWFEGVAFMAILGWCVILSFIAFMMFESIYVYIRYGERKKKAT